ncbi:unnamed protein product [Citrullus colocynthis]|uniref:Uncharacterized protein n=1 Tax=Citrullus colocynthis TaxID=252529 RepID=A0ABP0YCX8_9ROSI
MVARDHEGPVIRKRTGPMMALHKKPKPYSKISEMTTIPRNQKEYAGLDPTDIHDLTWTLEIFVQKTERRNETEVKFHKMKGTD